MKQLFTILALCLAASAVQAQTYVRYSITNLFAADNFGSGQGTNSISFAVPSNTLAKVISSTANVATPGTFYVSYPGSADADFSQAPVVLGPATVNFRFTGWLGSPASANCVVRFEPVNIAPAVTGFAVQPPQSSAQVRLETSTDLKTWQASAPGVYGLTNESRFFRLNLNVTP